jgi:hypothetical protein
MFRFCFTNIEKQTFDVHALLQHDFYCSFVLFQIRDRAVLKNLNQINYKYVNNFCK